MITGCGKVFLPYIQGVIDKIAKKLGKKVIFTQFTTTRTIKQRMRYVKDDIDQQQLKGVYKIDCSCSKSYIGEIRRLLQRRLKENGTDIKNERLRSSVLTEHSLKTKHQVCLENVSSIAR